MRFEHIEVAVLLGHEIISAEGALRQPLHARAGVGEALERLPRLKRGARSGDTLDARAGVTHRHVRPPGHRAVPGGVSRPP